MTPRILIVDDERDNRELLAIILVHEGFLVLTAGSGEEALAIVAQHPPDLVLLDIMMPGMDGYEVAAAIKGDVATKHIQVVMVSALDDRSGRAVAASAGADDFLTKPMDRAALCERLTTLLASSRTPRNSRDADSPTARAYRSRQRLGA